ncbi:histidine kinase [Gammaproteobacteria bacterium]
MFISSLDPVKPIQHIDDIESRRCRALVRSILWKVQIRWWFTGSILGFAALIPALGLTLNPLHFLVAGTILLLTNFVSCFCNWKIDPVQVRTCGLQWKSFHQVMGEYLALSVVVYALGSIETPVMLMVLPNIIFSTLFFQRSHSFMITLFGLVMISLPLLLESFGILPIVSIYSHDYKQAMLKDPLWLGFFVGVLTICVLYCWYLADHITERLIRSELKLEKDYWDIQRLITEKNQTTLRATHEIKAPLAAIKSYVYTLRDGYAGPLPPQAQAIVERIGQRCDRLLKQVSDTIRLANLQSYVVFEDELKSIDLLPVLSLEVEEIRGIGAMRGIVVSFESPVEPLIVLASEEHLRTIFNNLLSNALNYSRDGGQVKVAVEWRGDLLQVTIRDQGIGIPAEAQSKVFEEHFRAANAAAHHSGGTGLGLPIVKATVRILGAQLILDSEVGEGTCLTVLFKTTNPPEVT